MDKLGNFVSTVKDSDVWQTESGAGDKVVKCLAVIGAISTVKALWPTVKGYFGQKEADENAEGVPAKEEQPKSQKASQLKARYGGEWALITDSSD